MTPTSTGATQPPAGDRATDDALGCAKPGTVLANLFAPSSPAPIRRAAALLKAARFAVAFTGAGISTASGIPDFRSHESGLWHAVDPMTVASLAGFRQQPEAFYQWVQPLAQRIVDAQPNAAHQTLAQLETAGYLKAIITQNIDMLHTRAGSQTVYELHGHLRQVTCIRCFKLYPAAPILTQFLSDGQVPHCPDCGGVLKPNLILFGEQLPVRDWHNARHAARTCDLMLVIGASLEVAPACDLPLLAHRTGAHLIVLNLEPTPVDQVADVLLHANAADVLPALLHCLETLP
jgi:NAD-dependent deacetylase